MAGGRGCLKLARLSSARPLVPGSSPLLDLLAPRVFRGVDSASTRWGTAARAGSSAAAVRPVEGHPAVAEDAADSDGDGKGETAVAGPSRWAGQLSESKGGVPTEYKAAAYKGKGRQSGTALHIPTISTDIPPSDLLPLLDTPSRQRRRPAPLASHFLTPNPPSPSALSARYPLTRQNGDLLIRYAQRVEDSVTETSIRDTLGRERIAPVSWISPPLRWDRRQRKPPRTPRIGETVDGEQAFGSGDDPPEPAPLVLGPALASAEAAEAIPFEKMHKPISPEMKKLRAGSNAWARRMWPPSPPEVHFPRTWGAEEPVKPYRFLCDTHRQILDPKPARRPFIDSLRALEALPGVKDRDLLSLLHLHLSYPLHTPYRTPREPPPHLGQTPVSSPSSLLTPFSQFLLRVPHIPPTRQTLHLLVLSLLYAPVHTFPTSSDRKTQVSDLVTLFRVQFALGPGCETYRHMARYALLAGDQRWAREAWEGWWAGKKRVDEAVAEEDGAKAEWERGMDEDWADRRTEGMQGEDVIFRFRHRGRELQRWFAVVKALEKKGWVEQVVHGGQGDKAGWEWIAHRQPAAELGVEETALEAELVATEGSSSRE
ncbi:uncharacterized protein MKK02DRAFT_43296 [Dioszegia hungarica]|uniref:Uncharacterized protein n=1 Tax=Dioszegia hungarica TaxID=4972 RepID=A0AA38HBW1_9TREE|nr:uncharacterized protein MKK02DRAFT_43296 [Dioszegia hungarica]KAI9637370.1 hypothetical protein MKK02DRAFT_43296 [Dioszegia hungarica]